MNVSSRWEKHVLYKWIYRIQRRKAIKNSGVIIFQEAVEITSSNLSVSFFACFES